MAAGLVSGPAAAANAAHHVENIASAGPSTGLSLPVNLQLLLPSSPWNWPTDSNGTSSAALYEFCSWMPASSESTELYSPATTRFSDGYRLFLNCLQSDALTSQALREFESCEYRTAVLYAEAPQQSMPAWNVSQFPQAWLASVSGGSSTAGTIHVRLPAAGERGGTPNSTCFGILSDDGTDTPVPLSAGKGQSVEIHADAWGMITVRPAGWYDGALVAVKSSGPYSTGDASSFFGPHGVMRNLLTGMCVALHPTVSASVTPSVAARLQQARSPGLNLRVGGLVFERPEVSDHAALSDGLTKLTATALLSASDAVIVGVTVSPLGVGSG